MSEMDRVVEEVERRTGLQFSGHQRKRMLRAVRETAASRGCRSLDTFARTLTVDVELFGQLADRLVIGETYFFRDRGQMDLLRRHVLPAAASGRLRIWSAGCASGEEAYTLAMLAHDAGLAGKVAVLGTDLSRSALARAEAAEYGTWSLRAVPEVARTTWFEALDRRYRVRAPYRAPVRFRHGNLLDDPPGRFDLVVCRNVLLYLTPDAIRRASEVFVEALRPGGWLITGASDPPLEVGGLHREMTPAGLAYRRTGDDRLARSPAADQPRQPTSSRRARPAPASPKHSRRPPPLARPPDSSLPEARPGTTLDAPLHCALATQYLDAGRMDDAAAAARAALYLDPTLGVAHLVLGHCERFRGNEDAAARCYRLAARALAALPPESEAVPGSGEPAGHLAAMATQLAKVSGPTHHG